MDKLVVDTPANGLVLVHRCLESRADEVKALNRVVLGSPLAFSIPSIVLSCPQLRRGSANSTR